ncbi:MAG TPA: hypothetical protein PLV05_01960 [Verrucomicrobiota bacterium]|nr:hypothetical protein [Verrucomicrobiota bacterium]HPC51845.1 hypothetical protein [Verrucomicrobiota bacterium]HPL35724.1 hypothetical protein [Verrucomicrobiota bacterium]HRV39070.1 hypothetical protein [Candidatus Paceibacterota bacterium]
MKGYLTRAFALTLTATIFERLTAPKAVGVGVPGLPLTQAPNAPVLYRAEGCLPLKTHREVGDTIVSVRILVPNEWTTIPPVAYSSAPFIRKEPDWHVQADGSLCHVLPDHWAWEMNQCWEQTLDIGYVIETAAAWCLLNVDSLVTRHLHGHRFGLTKWPKQWEQWGHGPRGVAEFQTSLQNLTKAAA